jgi:hypothetical protein
MVHPDPSFRYLGTLKTYWIRLILGKLLSGLAILAIILLISSFQERGLIGIPGTSALLLILLAAAWALFFANFVPRPRCPECARKMQSSRIVPAHPSPSSESALILSCSHCKTYLDLAVSEI